MSSTTSPRGPAVRSQSPRASTTGAKRSSLSPAVDPKKSARVEELEAKNAELMDRLKEVDDGPVSWGALFEQIADD